METDKAKVPSLSRWLGTRFEQSSSFGSARYGAKSPVLMLIIRAVQVIISGMILSRCEQNDDDNLPFSFS
jgi:hypothetical protein